MTDADLLKLDDRAFIEQAYREALGRAADPQGLSDYSARLQLGVPKAQVLLELRLSDEGRREAARRGRPLPVVAQRSLAPRVTPGLDELLALRDEAFVEQAYRVVLGRAADLSGRRAYLMALQRGVARLDVLHELLHSAEGQRANLPLPELRAVLARRKLQRLPGLRQALRVFRRVGRRVRLTARRGPARGTLGLPTPRSMATEGRDPLRPRDGVRRGLRPPPHPMNMPHTDDATTASRMATAGELHDQALADMLAADAPEAPHPANLHAERFVGPLLHGWSSHNGRGAACSVALAGRNLCRIVPDIERPDLAGSHGLADTTVGFSAVLGGLLQFVAMAPACHRLVLAQQAEGGPSLEIDLRAHTSESLTFAPMRALARPLPRQAGHLRSMRLLSPTEAALVFEADSSDIQPAPGLFVELYQEGGAGELARVGRFAIELGGQLHDLRFTLRDPRRPLLMVVTDAERALIATDCFPLPALFADRHGALIEYHVVLENGTAAFAVAAKLSRSFLDHAIESAQPRAATGAGPRRDSTLLLLYGRAGTDLAPASRFAAHGALAPHTLLLDEQGRTLDAAGRVEPLRDTLQRLAPRHVLLADADDTLRPDFWAVLESNRFRFDDQQALVHWHALWLEPGARAQVVKSPPLLHPAFAGHRLLENRAMLVTRATLERALAEHGEDLCSGRLVLEKVFDFVPPQATACLPVPMHTVRVPFTPMQLQRFLGEHVAVPASPRSDAPQRPGPGVSAIINYRDGVADTLRCLASLAMQQLDGPLQVVLVNNGSTPASVQAVLDRAHELFGKDRVTALDYPHRFNHSTQCNVAAMAARHEMLLMLSNDSVLVTPRAVARAAAVAAVPWVGTCGFRIVGNEAAKRRLQSLGLALSPRRHLFSGGSPVGRNLVPGFALDCTLEVAGNTFAAVMLRRDVYRQLDGLDAEAFPTNYNDIDFSFRATNAGFRHVALGSEVVEHVGRGSREADQDLPIDQRIVERAPRLDQLARMGFQQL